MISNKHQSASFAAHNSNYDILLAKAKKRNEPINLLLLPLDISYYRTSNEITTDLSMTEY